MIAYLESSAAAKLLTDEPEGAVLALFLNQLALKNDSVVSSTLLETELRRAANRESIPQGSVTALLDRVDIFDLPRSTYTEAGILPGGRLRSLDAIHIAAAMRVDADVMVTYDQRQLDAAESAGMRVVSPK
jgi:uncharacterized protein